jgi:hypothetical protein
MLIPAPPMSNTERQRQFRERNPGYYGRLHARRRAGENVAAAQLQAAAQAMAMKREPLALPAPAEKLEIPGMNMIPAIPALSQLDEARRSPLPVSEQATFPPHPAKSLAA